MDAFKIPESVLYDSKRDILYPSSFDRVQASHVDTGFISRVKTNGLFLHEGGLIVGNAGDGLLKGVNLPDGSVTAITSFGAGVIDGIRVDNAG